MIELEAVGAKPAYLRLMALIFFILALGKEVDDLWIAFKETDIKRLKVGDHLVIQLALDPGPSH